VAQVGVKEGRATAAKEKLTGIYKPCGFSTKSYGLENFAHFMLARVIIMT
jgi:hypothetical protein